MKHTQEGLEDPADCLFAYLIDHPGSRQTDMLQKGEEHDEPEVGAGVQSFEYIAIQLPV